jgi:hypothetical protein
MTLMTGCVMPHGDYENSCENITVSTYISSDSFAPESCRLEADCKTMFSGLPAIHNVIFLPQNIDITNVNNNNGTLSYGGNLLSIKVADGESLNNANFKPDYKCVKPSGSYSKTCTVETSPYHSSDPIYKYTELCSAQISCLKLNGIEKSHSVYFNIHQDLTTLNKIENCDGSILVDSIDNQ